MNKFEEIGVIKNEPIFDKDRLEYFIESVKKIKNSNIWSRDEIVSLFIKIVPEFKHKETGKFLDNRM
jgi:chorismate mutase